MSTPNWTVETLNETVDRELNSLPVDMRARFVRMAQLIEAVGLEHVREPHVRHVRDAIWEMRLTGRSGIARALYVTAPPKRVVVVHVFVKKKQKTPAVDLDIAVKRAEDLRR